MSLTRIAILSVSLMVIGAGVVSGQDYPSKSIRIFTTAAGGGGDFVARQIAQGISGALGQPVVVDNRTALIASETVSKAPPDGYTLICVGGGFLVFPLVQKAPYAVADFAPISLVSRNVLVVAVHPSLPVKSIKELVALAKAKPGELNYGSAGIGGSPHLAAELFKSMAGVNIVRINYQGTASAITALVSGEVQVIIIDAGGVMPHAKAGRLRALAVTSAEPSALVPGLPSVAASGLPGYEATGITGIYAPAKTSAAIVNQLNQEIVRFLNQPVVKDRLLSVGEEVIRSSPEQFAAFIKAEIAKTSKVIKDAGIKVE